MLGGVFVGVVMLLLAAAAQARQPQADIWPWVAIGRVERGAMGSAASEAAFCTGTLVAPDIVLTAAHCLHDHQTGALLPAESLEFAAGYSQGRWAARALGRFVLPAEQFCMGCAPGDARSASDWGLLVLAEALPVPPIPLALVSLADLRRLSPNGLVSTAGFGVDDPERLDVRDGCRLQAGPASSAPWRHDCRLTMGDSGAPLLVVRGQSWAIVAIHVAVQGHTGLAVPAGIAAGLLDRMVQGGGQ